MVAYNYQKRFAPLVEAGTKTQTVRGPRKRHARPGEVLQNYTGMRTKSCRLLRLGVCTDVKPVRLSLDPCIRLGEVRIGRGLSATYLGGSELDEFANDDGFEDWFDLATWWDINHRGKTVFEGFLIKWEPEPS